MWYNSLNDYLKTEYGKKLFKLALDAGCTCPNRDGTCGTRGCIFCSGAGSGDFASDRSLTITEQIAQAKERIRKKVGEKPHGYIAYFQAFTSTYGPTEKLYKMYLEAVNEPTIDIISIATRPDCLSSEILEVIEKVNRIKPVWIELGLQTIHEKTAKYIRRGYPLETYDEAVRKLNELNIPVITHVILGLPNETIDDMLKTVSYIGKHGEKGIKLQLLHVLKNTDLATDYRNGYFKAMELGEYIDVLEKCIRILPKDIVIHRLTGDGPKKDLIAPLWSGNKKNVINTIRREFTNRNVIQGSINGDAYE